MMIKNKPNEVSLLDIYNSQEWTKPVKNNNKSKDSGNNGGSNGQNSIENVSFAGSQVTKSNNASNGNLIRRKPVTIVEKKKNDTPRSTADKRILIK